MIKVVPNWVIALIAALMFAATFGYGHHVGTTSNELKHSTETVLSLEASAKREAQLRTDLELERSRLRDVSGKLQDALGKNGDTVNVVTKTITKEVEKPVYRDSHLPSSGVQVLSDAAERFNSLRSAKD